LFIRVPPLRGSDPFNRNHPGLTPGANPNAARWAGFAQSPSHRTRQWTAAKTAAQAVDCDGDIAIMGIALKEVK